MKKFLLFAAAALVASSASAKWESIITGGKAADGETASIKAAWTGNAPVVDAPAGDVKAFKLAIPEQEPNKDGKFDDWQCQMFICFNEGEALQENDVVKISFDHYCTDTRNIGMQTQGNQGTYSGGINGFETKPEWQTYSAEVTVTAGMAAKDGGFKTIAVCCASIAPAADFYMNNVVVEKKVEGDDPEEPAKDILASFYAGEGSGTLGGWGGNAKFENVEEDGKSCLKVENPEECANIWDVQFAMNYDFTPGETYYISMDVKGTEEAEINSGIQNNKTYSDGGSFTPFKITKEWSTQTISCTAKECEGEGGPNRWTPNMGKYVGTAWFTNIILYTLKGDAVDAVVVPVKVNTGVYNLQGVKVADSLDEVTVPGLYISNGKKYIKK